VHVRDPSRSLPDARLHGEQPGRRLERKGRRARHGQESEATAQDVDLFRVDQQGEGPK